MPIRQGRTVNGREFWIYEAKSDNGDLRQEVRVVSGNHRDDWLVWMRGRSSDGEHMPKYPGMLLALSGMVVVDRRHPEHPGFDLSILPYLDKLNNVNGMGDGALLAQQCETNWELYERNKRLGH